MVRRVVSTVLFSHSPIRRIHAGFTLVEVLIVITIGGILMGWLLLVTSPKGSIERARYANAKESLVNIAKAAQMYADDNNGWAPDVDRSIPPGFATYVSQGYWQIGAFPGSVYDWDNWRGRTCWDGSPGGLQVTLRQINDYKGKRDYTLYYVIEGDGIPHCDTATTRGECINCVSRYP